MIELDLQVAVGEETGVPPQPAFRKWVGSVLGDCEAALTIRVVGEAEGAELNGRYRGKEGPTNVLSFPFEPSIAMDIPLLGDIVICAPVVEREAGEQGKPPEAHWAHMVVHGCLHLLGYDHIDTEEARVMEGRESEILARLGYDNPY